MKNVTTTIIALFTIASSVFANNTNPGAASLSATVNNNTVVLNFAANSNFEIERSFYSNEFATISSVNIASNTVNNFKINDNAAELAGRKVAYYRVKTIAANGTVTYSNTTVVNLEAAEGSIVTKSTINFNAAQNGNAVITVKNAAGKTIAVKNTIASKGTNTTVVTNGLAKGIYTATIAVNGVTVDTQKVIAE